jgi:prenyltransferase beta subunit
VTDREAIERTREDGHPAPRAHLPPGGARDPMHTVARRGRMVTRILPRLATTGLALLVLLLLAAGPGATGQGIPPRPPGVTAEAEAALERGVAYLARTQGPDGSWRSSGSYGGTYPVAMTGLAALALAGSGSSLDQGPHAPALVKAVEFILKQQARNGHFKAPGEQRSMYGHGFCMLALAQVYGGEGSLEMRRRIHDALTSAVRLTAKSQSAQGGWYYEPRTSADEGSVTITQLQALRACRNAGIKVPKETIEKAVQYVYKAQNADGGIAYRAGQRGNSRPPISAAGLCSLYSAGIYEGERVEKLLRYVKRTVRPQLGHSHAWYTQLYMGQAMWMAGKEHWDEYGKELVRLIVSRQSSDGGWSDGRVGGVYGTSIACILLQLPYRHLPIMDR